MKNPVEILKNKASRAYCDYIDQLRKSECLGWEQKVKSGKFGAAELKAHNRAHELLGKHRAYTEAAQAIRDLDPWIPVEEGLPEPDAVRIIDGLSHSIQYLTDGKYGYNVALYRKDRDSNLWWDDYSDEGVAGVTHYQRITEVNHA